MSLARKHQINIENTPYYHCMSRCVRQAYLCGEDKHSGKNFNHRKQWIVDRLAVLASTFAIDVCGFAIMTSHFHLILNINPDKAKNWSEDDVIRRWTQIFKGSSAAQLYIRGMSLTDSESRTLFKQAKVWREQLTSISWFMRCLNQPIAQMANKEDGCTGRFWSGRFKSQALLDEQALLASMVYVDLNPIRADICDNLESSEFTSIFQRIQEYKQAEIHTTDSTNNQTDQPVNPQRENSQPQATSKISNQVSLKPKFNPSNQNQNHVPLAQFIGGDQNQKGIPYSLADYIELADWTGRAIRPDKRGYIPESEPKIIQKLGIDSDNWLETVNGFSDSFYIFIGPKEIMETIGKKLNKSWLTGIQSCRQLFNHQNPLSS